jgi:hypothetical protein
MKDRDRDVGFDIVVKPPPFRVAEHQQQERSEQIQHMRESLKDFEFNGSTWSQKRDRK